MFRYYNLLLLSIALIAGSALPHSEMLHADKLDGQRMLFSEIERSLKSGRQNLFKSKRDLIKDYPLYPYLQFHYYKLQIKSLTEEKVNYFSQRYATVPVSQLLRREWLLVTAKRGQWEVFARNYRASPLYPSKELACYYATALIRTGQIGAAQAELEKLWTVNFSQPSQCDYAFKWGFSEQLIDDALIWQRLLLTIRKNPSLAEYLSKKLSAENRHWYAKLKAARRDPSANLIKWREDLPTSAFVRDIANHTMRRLAWRDIDEAKELWKIIRNSYNGTAHKYTLQRELGIIAAGESEFDFAYDLLSELPAEYHTSDSREWLIRTAMCTDRWSRALDFFSLLDSEQSEESRWQYWRAVSLSKTGKSTEAMTVWNKLAQGSSYFSYLAADRANVPYVLATRPIRIPQRELENPDSRQAIDRMRELIKLNYFTDGRREIFVASDYFTQEAFLRLALEAEQWKWSDGAIRAIAKSQFEGDTKVRFPIAYQAEIKREAKRHQAIPEEWIYGVIRRESVFMERARSPAGALGLMQLMPKTARSMSSELKLPYATRSRILKPATNIRLGAAYLNKLHKRYDGYLPYMLAGYNAGGTRVTRWRQRIRVQDPALWIEAIPYKETREYVPAVLYYIVIYAHRLDRKTQRLKDLL